MKRFFLEITDIRTKENDIIFNIENINKSICKIPNIVEINYNETKMHNENIKALEFCYSREKIENLRDLVKNFCNNQKITINSMFSIPDTSKKRESRARMIVLIKNISEEFQNLIDGTNE